MKTFKIVMIVILSGLALCLCVTLGLRISMGTAWSSVEVYSDYSLVQEKEFSAGDITALSISYPNSADVLFYESSDDTIVVKEYMNFTPKEDQLSTIEKKGSSLLVKGKRRSFTSFMTFFSSSPDSYTEIYLPSGFAASLQVQTVSGDIRSELSFTGCSEFSAGSTSGDIVFPYVEAGKISVSSTSGSLRLGSAEGGSVRLSTTSGDITLEQLTGAASVSSTSGDITLEQLTDAASVSCTSGEVRIGSAGDSLDIDTVSGDIRLDNLNGTFSLNTTSGEITVNDGTGCGRAGTVSGDIRIFLSELTGNLTLSTTSGGVNLSLPETASFTLDFDSTSGECNTFFDDVLSFSKKGNEAKGQYGNNAGNKLEVSTVSGDLRIIKSTQ